MLYEVNQDPQGLIFFSVCIQVISKYLRLDKGTETGHMATIHAFLRQDQDNEPETVFYGPSTNNKVKTEQYFTIFPESI